MFSYQFQYPAALWLISLVLLFALLFALYMHGKKKAIKRIGDVKLVKAMFPHYSPAKSILRFALVSIAFILGCLALANPRMPDESSGEARKGIDIVIALDVSNSMLASDIAPDRLSRAKQFIATLIDNLENDRIGLVVFAGNAYAQMPLTFDREAAKLYVSAANPSNIAAQGTSIGDAFEKSAIVFGDETDRFRSVVLITDGETHDDNAINGARQMASRGVMINTIGIGSPQGSTITDIAGNTKRDASGKPVITKLNDQILKELAALTNGTYIHLQNSGDAVAAIMEQYTQIEKKALGDSTLFSYHTFFTWFALPMLVMLMLEIFIPDRKKVK